MVTNDVGDVNGGEEPDFVKGGIFFLLSHLGELNRLDSEIIVI